MDLFAKIEKIKYNPHLCKDLDEIDIVNLEIDFKRKGSFLLNLDKQNRVACSWWVSSKRTRSYPYARIYDTLNFSGKKITIIPVFKDEGFEGDRDFVQWDTISLMSLLGIYVLISYYNKASKSAKYENKITNQIFDYSHIQNEIKNLKIFQSDALHWNLEQIDKIGEIAEKALARYEKISSESNVKMHSYAAAPQRIQELQKGRSNFLLLSRRLAKQAQYREQLTTQPKELTIGDKSSLTIKNYLGGHYYFTCDETKIVSNDIYIYECKHSERSILPSINDIKDGLIKMALFGNIGRIKVGRKIYRCYPVLKLTSPINISFQKLPRAKQQMLQYLNKEATENGFKIMTEHITL